MKRTLLTLGLGILLAAGAVFLMNVHINAKLPRLAAPAPQMNVGKVVVATKDIPFGSAIRRDFLKVVDWPTAYLPDGAFANIDDVFGASDETRVAIRPIIANEPLLTRKVSGHGDRPILSAKLAETKRAYSISVNDVSGVSGFILPGDRVDVLMTREHDAGKDSQTTDVILQDISVLGIDQLTDETREDPRIARTATVEVAPDQAQKLALAQQVGTLSLALRAVNSADKVAASTVRVSDLVETTRRRTYEGPTVTVRKGTDNASTRSVRVE